ncbi:hypothetical protein [Photobacterium phosphoreum]|uniref:hypothetical protein n=1 Tax=Photobacterium phosphoreum TaxID=659 RepID=UPI000D157B53|nr:hypothetical protein [Photobacterium phosphoreum]PSU58377.1 hypothetical protein CTM75_16960 [Photobacterium phosphoreum]
MEQDLMISLEDFASQTDANSLGNAVMESIRALHKQHQLDLTGLKRILISFDFANALKKVTEGYGHISPSSFTDSKQAIAVAQLVTKGAREEFTLVLGIDFFFEWFNSDCRFEIREDNISVVLHRIHHELIHIHEKNVLTQLDASLLIDGYDDALLMAATRSWSEYLANLKSASSAPEETVRMFIEQLDTIIKEVPHEIESLVRKYQCRLISLDEMYIAVKDRIKLIVNSYAYAFGCVDAFGIDLDSYFPELTKSLKESKLSDTFYQLGISFKYVTELYEQRLVESFDAFDEIVKVIDSIFKVFGLTLERTQSDSGVGLYIHVE